MLPFTVTFRPGNPHYEDIVFAVKRALATGILREGAPFPSVRTVSRELKLNPNTCQRAVSVLVDAGILEVRPGVGTFVAKRVPLNFEEALHLLKDPVENLVVEAKQLGLSEDELHDVVTHSWREIK
ncbi:MAG: GntR family transcriptional regulator [Verrucomicrobiales bacterium]|nr:GntR family transcriptional regulator [Verrucomicrobiales bacterium]